MTASDARSTSIGLTVGSRDEGLLGSIASGYVVRKASATFPSEQTGTSLGASVAFAGTELRGRVEICPGIGITQIKVTGDHYAGGRATLTQTSRRGGVSAGYKLTPSPRLLVIPFASVEYVRFGGSVKGSGVSVPVPWDSYVPVSLGLGTVLRDRFGLTCALTIPTSLPRGVGRNTFLISGSAALGSR
jgi:hypothetical protein